MAKNLKLDIKNTQIAQVLKLTKKIKPKSSSTLTKKGGKKKGKPTTSTSKPKARILPTKEAVEKPTKEKKAKPTALTLKPKVRILPPKEAVEKPTKEKKAKPTAPTLKPKVRILPPKEAVEKPTKEKKGKPSKKEEKKVPPPKEKSKVPPKEPPLKEKIRKELPLEEKKILKPLKKLEIPKHFDTRDRMGLRIMEEERWRKKRIHKPHKKTPSPEQVIRPSHLKIKIPISIKDLAVALKLKGSQLIEKLFLQGIVVTLNDLLEDETTIQLLGHEFGCEITIDTSEEERLKITGKTIKEEITDTPKENLQLRPPIITFMGHVDHGKTSLIDCIRQSNLAAQEAGDITQHIGAFTASTESGNITILDTPGHEAFSQMRSRGATVTDIIILVIAGDEGIKAQTIEAIEIAKEAKTPIIVAINKADKAEFNAEKVHRQLADHDLLPEAWGGTTITINCSASTKEGISDLLEMILLQAEILELRANPNERARGTILESQMHKGLGAVATVLVQNGTLKIGDSIVFEDQYGRIKTMHNQYDHLIREGLPSTPVKITGLSGLAEAGCEFIAVKDEKEAKFLAYARRKGFRRRKMQQPQITPSEKLLKKEEKKVLPLILRADVQGSLEALKISLLNISSKKVKLDIVSGEVGEISESDIMLAAASKATIIGFHTRIESHAEHLIRQLNINVKLHNIIYHAIEDVTDQMTNLLEKLEQENDTGKAIVKTVFKSSQLGAIAGSLVTEGIIKRNSYVRLVRENNIIWKGKIASLKRLKEDVKEVPKGIECGILLENFTDIQGGDEIQAYDITYIKQELE